MFTYWCEQYPTVQLIKLYAYASSDEGLGLMKHLFFSPRYDLGENAFELDPYRYNPSRLIQDFQACISSRTADPHVERQPTRQTTAMKHTRFIKATAEDMPAAVAFANAVFGGIRTIPVERRAEWLNKNPDIDYRLKHDERSGGYLSLVPLRPETIGDLLTERRFARDLTAEDILPYTPGVPVDIYGMAIGVLPGVSRAQKREWGARLVMGARSVLTSLGERCVTIRTLKAHSNTPDGIRLMRHLGFTETAPNIPGMRDFVIDVAHSGLPFLAEYKVALRRWQEQHKG